METVSLEKKDLGIFMPLKFSRQATIHQFQFTLEYRINGGGGENNRWGGGWKWFDITIIGGLEQ